MKLPGEKPLILEKRKGKGSIPISLVYWQIRPGHEKAACPGGKAAWESYQWIPGALEWNLVVHVSKVVGLLLVGRHGGRIVVLRGLGLPVVVGTGSGLLAGGAAHVGGIAAAGEELDVFSDHAAAWSASGRMPCLPRNPVEDALPQRRRAPC